MMNRRFLVVIVMAGCGFGCDSKEAESESGKNGDTKPIPKPAITSDPAAAPTPESKRGAVPVVDAPATDSENPDYVSFPTLGIRIVRPAGFEDAKDFHGFQQLTSSVLAMTLQGPFSKISSGFDDPERMKAAGMKLLSKEDLAIDEVPGVLIGFEQSAHGEQFSKWSLVFGTEEETTMVTATCLSSDAPRLSATLKATVLSTRKDNSPRPVPGSDAGFTIEESDKLSFTSYVGKMLMCTKDGVMPLASAEDPLFIIGPSVAPAPIEDRGQFAVQRLSKTAHTKIGSIKSNKAVKIDGLDGLELIADAEDIESGIPLAVYFVVLFRSEGYYYLAQGIVGESTRDEYVPEFKRMAHSFQRDSK